MLAAMKKGKWDTIELEYDNYILRLRPQADLVYELDDLLSFHQHVLEFTQTAKFLVLSDFREHHLSLSKEVIQYAAKNPELNEAKLAEAVLVKPLPNMMVARFFINVLRPLTTTKIFRSEDQAMEWLEQVRAAELEISQAP